MENKSRITQPSKESGKTTGTEHNTILKDSEGVKKLREIPAPQ